MGEIGKYSSHIEYNSHPVKPHRHLITTQIRVELKE